MCFGCWQEFDAPAHYSAGIIAAVVAVRRLNNITFNGGLAHVVTEDWNCDDENIKSCLASIVAYRAGDIRFAELEYPASIDAANAALHALLAIPEDDRYAALAHEAGYTEDPLCK